MHQANTGISAAEIMKSSSLNCPQLLARMAHEIFLASHIQDREMTADFGVCVRQCAGASLHSRFCLVTRLPTILAHQDADTAFGGSCMSDSPIFLLLISPRV